MAPTLDHALGEVLVEVIAESRTCEYCAEQVYNQVITYSHHRVPENHWRTHCDACKRYCNPKTGVFDLRPGAITQYYRDESAKSDK